MHNQEMGSRPTNPPRHMDNSLYYKELQVERKHLILELCENDRGQFLRIMEESHGRRNTVIVPSTGLKEFAATLAEVAGHADPITD